MFAFFFLLSSFFFLLSSFFFLLSSFFFLRCGLDPEIYSISIGDGFFLLLSPRIVPYKIRFALEKAMFQEEGRRGRIRKKKNEKYERVLYRHRAILLFLRVHREFVIRQFRPHGGWWAEWRRWRNWTRCRGTRKRGRVQGEERQCTIRHVMTCGWAVFSQRHVLQHLLSYKCARKYACEGVLFTPAVGYSGSLSTVDETNCDKKEIRAKKKLWAHFQLHSDACHHEELEVEGQHCHPVCWSIRALDR